MYSMFFSHRFRYQTWPFLLGIYVSFQGGVVIVQLPGSFGETLLVTHCTSVTKNGLGNFSQTNLGEKLLMEEILHQWIGSLSHYLQGFIHVRWCRISSTNRMIVKFECLFKMILLLSDHGESPSNPSFGEYCSLFSTFQPP